MRTLLEPEIGNRVDLDRDLVRISDGRLVVTTFRREFVLVGADVERAATISARGTLVGPDTIQVDCVHVNATGMRDFASVAGLLVVAWVWLRLLRRNVQGEA